MACSTIVGLVNNKKQWIKIICLSLCSTLRQGQNIISKYHDIKPRSSSWRVLWNVLEGEKATSAVFQGRYHIGTLYLLLVLQYYTSRCSRYHTVLKKDKGKAKLDFALCGKLHQCLCILQFSLISTSKKRKNCDIYCHIQNHTK